MKTCALCKKQKPYLSNTLKICLDCIRKKPKSCSPFIQEAHRRVRARYNLPVFPPKTKKGLKCEICDNQCQMGEGERSYCGLRINEQGKLKTLVSPDLGLLYYYFDIIPTNCCAAWFCEATKKDFRKKNLSVFFYGCPFDCLFCQNYSHKNLEQGSLVKVEDLLKVAEDPQAVCVCFFGGSPESQLPFTINFSQKILKKKKIRICLEGDGIGNENLMRKLAQLSLESGGIIKFDLKAFDETLSFALSGVSNKKAYQNFEMLAKEFFPKRKEPVLTATTLLVPGYVDKFEVEKIAKFIAKLSPEIPYSLLVFFPAFEMIDLPVTPRDWAFDCFEVAKKYLKNVNLGNKHLLGL